MKTTKQATETKRYILHTTSETKVWDLRTIEMIHTKHSKCTNHSNFTLHLTKQDKIDKQEFTHQCLKISQHAQDRREILMPTKPTTIRRKMRLQERFIQSGRSW